MTISKLSKPLVKMTQPVRAGANIFVNVCHYTYNIAPRVADSFKKGRSVAIALSKENNYCGVRTFFLKTKEIAKSIFEDMNILEVPVILSTLAIPTTPPGGSPIAFGLGCLIITPVLVKKLLTNELTFEEIKNFLSKMCKKDYIELDPKIKNNLKNLFKFNS